MLTTADFDYVLPARLIAQRPLAQPEAARLLVVGRTSGRLAHKHFRDLKELLRPDDILVFNNSRVIPARLLGKTADKKSMEFLLLERHGRNWEILARPGKRLEKASNVTFGSGKALLTAQLVRSTGNGTYMVRFAQTGAAFDRALHTLGVTPTPPYITQHARLAQYQNVFAKTPGSVAAPTAGLHFSKKLLGQLRAAGIAQHFVTLHVGLGTFQPVKTERLAQHKMHSERYFVDRATVSALNRAKKEGRRIIAVGTTTVRVLESLATTQGKLRYRKGSQATNIFITPGYRFRFVDGLITNFHLPKSTLLMLVSAFSSLSIMRKAYTSAIRHGYRFYSFGDGMFIV